MRAAVVLLIGALGACSRPPPDTTGAEGDPQQGKAAIAQAHCGACHRIPGLADAHGEVGPPLGGIGRRTVIAGVLPNTPANLASWIRTPQAVKPGDAMPNAGLGERQARDIAAYLATLR